MINLFTKAPSMYDLMAPRPSAGPASLPSLPAGVAGAAPTVTALSGSGAYLAQALEQVRGFADSVAANDFYNPGWSNGDAAGQASLLALGVQSSLQRPYGFAFAPPPGNEARFGEVTVSAAPGTASGGYGLEYDAVQGGFRLTDGTNVWTATVDKDGTQTVTFGNGIQLRLGEGFRRDNPMEAMLFKVGADLTA